MTATSPVILRWWAGGPAPSEERFENLDAALDAVEERWDSLQDQAPQILDARRVLMISTDDLHKAMDAEEQEGAGEPT